MGLLIFMQVVLDLGFIATATWLLIDRSRSKTMEDPRLSRGLQLLSSKIAILQDLMDRSENMSKQLNQLMDGKQADIQERLEEVEIYLHKIQKATERSQEVVDIFQDRVPHQEMIERQTSAKYLMAAKLSHQGVSIEEIAAKVDIPRGELDLIVKLNRERIIVNQGSNPEPDASASAAPVPVSANANANATATVTAQGPAVNQGQPVSQSQFQSQAQSQFQAPAQAHAHAPGTVAAFPLQSAGKKSDKEIRPVVFKKISVLDDLG